MSEHAPVSPSGLGRTIKCTGSLLASRGIKDEGDNFPADEGTTAHWGASEVLTSYKPGYDVKVVGDMVGKICPDTNMEFTQEMVEHVNLYVFYVLKLGTISDLYIEQRVQIPSIHPTECWGTLDAGSYDPDTKTLTIVDLKYGWRTVMPHVPQLIAYGDGLASALQLPDDIKVKLVIIQPRPFHRLGYIREWNTDVGTIRNEALALGVKVQEALAGGTLTPGTHCLYCKRLGDCPAFAESTLNAIDFAMEPDFSTVEYLPANRAKMLDTLNLAKEMINLRIAVEEENGMRLIKSGTPIPSYEIDHSAGWLKWDKSPKEMIAFGKVMGIDLQSDKPCTPPEAKKRGLSEKQVNQLSSRPGGKATLKKVNVEYAQHVFNQQ